MAFVNRAARSGIEIFAESPVRARSVGTAVKTEETVRRRGSARRSKVEQLVLVTRADGPPNWLTDGSGPEHFRRVERIARKVWKARVLSR